MAKWLAQWLLEQELCVHNVHTKLLLTGDFFCVGAQSSIVHPSRDDLRVFCSSYWIRGITLLLFPGNSNQGKNGQKIVEKKSLNKPKKHLTHLCTAQDLLAFAEGWRSWHSIPDHYNQGAFNSQEASQKSPISFT